MVRRHGWQYPAHTYQVAAITLFFSLAAIFYGFVSPFLGHTIKEYVAVGAFSPMALAVSFLYIRCTAIDPADPGVSSTGGAKAAVNQAEQPHNHKPSQITSDKKLLQSNKIVDVEGGRKDGVKQPYFSFLGVFGLLHLLFKWDNCGKDGASCGPVSQDDQLYCTLCDAEVNKFSKHCKSCDKCVEGFDHHCRWLNNCIGRKNYVSFVTLMAACLIMLSIETISGLMVLVRCFTDKHEIRIHLTSKLGNGFSIGPFSALVALYPLAHLLATIPLGELFFFHMLLIRKGISTYEYVVAMRVRNEVQASPQMVKQNTPMQNTRDWRNSNFVGMPYFGEWCNPRKVQQEGQALSQAEKRKLPCTVDTESTTVVERTGYRSSKNAVKISALKLAMLNPKEAARAAVKARENSSILRPVGFRSFHTSDADLVSSCKITPRSSVSLEHGPVCGRKSSRKEAENLPPQTVCSPAQDLAEVESDVDLASSRSHSPASVPLSPLPVERRFGNPNVLRTSVECTQMKDLGAARHGLQVCDATILPQSSVEHPCWICTTPMKEGREASRSSETVQLGRSHIISVERHTKDEKCDSTTRPAVYWDRAAGRFKSLPKSNHGMKRLAGSPHKSVSGNSWDLLGPHSILSPGRCLVNAKSASLRGPLISYALKNCGKENVSDVASKSSLSSTHSHIVLPSQSMSGGPPTIPCQSSTSACRTKPKKATFSRFTPS